MGRYLGSNVTQLGTFEQQGSVHEASVMELKHHVQQARTADKQLKCWHLQQAQRQIANILRYQTRLQAPPVIVDACCSMGMLVALFHPKYSDAIVIGIDHDKDRQYVKQFILVEHHHRFIFIKDDV